MDKDGSEDHDPAIQSFTAYKDKVGPTPKSQHISEHELTLPLYPTMTEEQEEFAIALVV